jgi:N-acetylmuramoyl-L-alanine amidase
VKHLSRGRGLWSAWLLLALIPAQSAHARAHHNDAWARERFANAERMREALNGRPAADRTRRDYQRVVNAYRSIYLGAPASSKADPSVVAVAETLVEMGRRFDDDKILNKAIEQYKFLRREYPGSKYRFDGMFTIGEIYKDDLNDNDAALATFQEFLHRYPHNHLAEDARQAIAELEKAKENSVAQKGASEKTAKISDQNNGQNGVDKNNSDKNVNGTGPIAPDDRRSHSVSRKDEALDAHAGRLPRVTGIRHWSTPDYTRVAIDVEGDVKFSSQRIASPARIFFDLRDTKLASTLVGKSFDVDDGFLKKVRVAQFAPGRTRVVLEVDNLSDYDAFLLPNPYRLIIDIHGKNGRAKPHTDGVEALEAKPEAVFGSPANAESDAGAKGTDLPDAMVETTAGVEATKSPTAAVPELSAESAKLPPGIVKRIVDAEGGDDSGSVPVTSAGKRAVKEAKNEAAVLRNDVMVRELGDSDSKGKPESASRLDTREARPTASGDRSLIRALGLKIGKIVIDPGHGGHDTGTIGPNGLEEKDLVLEVGKRLGKLLETRLGAEVVYTRKDDTFIPLETRTAIANQARADLFVSIHANSSHDPDARGVETYYLNFTSSPEALEVAARENAVSEKSIYELQDLVKKIALKEKIEESREFAGDVQASLHNGLAVKSPAIRNRGVKKAPFIVLIGANMPSILAEVSFVSNPTDEHRLASSEYRERIAESLYRGIAKYVNGLSGVKVASKMDKGAGQ